MSLYNTLKEAQEHLREVFGFPITLREKPQPEPPKEEKK